MILPIIAYGDPVLKRKAEAINKNYPQLSELIENMYDTMHKASGVGLAAPQVGVSIRLFVTDGTPFEDLEKGLTKFKKVFINPVVIKEEGKKWSYNEGCLSIPGIREDIERHEELQIEYYDEAFNFHQEKYSGMSARIVQHEYDHLEGVLFIDRLSGLRKRLLKKRLFDISKGNAEVDYKMKFPLKK